jgi:hypothetical protein
MSTTLACDGLAEDKDKGEEKMQGVPQACTEVAMDVQADIVKSTPSETMESVAALARCMTVNGGHYGVPGMGLKVMHSSTKPTYGMHGGITHMKGYGMHSPSPQSYYGYGSRRNY